MRAHKEWLKTIPCVYAIFTTPSGRGIKAIVLHDNRRKEQHQDLYAQLLKLLDCKESDTSTSDLGRGNYLSYDADVWVNPSPRAFHYEPSETIEVQQSKTHTVVKNNDGSPLLIEDDDSTCGFLNKLSMMIITDESIINMLRKNWTQQSLSRGRNNTALSYAGVLCKAGVEKQKAIDFIVELIPDLAQTEITRAVEYAYTHNIFGSNRRRYIKRKR